MLENGFLPSPKAFVWPPIWVIAIFVFLINRGLYVKIREIITSLGIVNCLVVLTFLFLAAAIHWYGIYKKILNIVLFLLSIVFFVTGIGTPLSLVAWLIIGINIATGKVNFYKLGLTTQIALQLSMMWSLGTLTFCVFNL